jgi:hypothetical protein
LGGFGAAVLIILGYPVAVGGSAEDDMKTDPSIYEELLEPSRKIVDGAFAPSETFFRICRLIPTVSDGINVRNGANAPSRRG